MFAMPLQVSTLWVVMVIMTSVCHLSQPADYQWLPPLNTTTSYIKHQISAETDESRAIFSKRPTQFLVMWLVEMANQSHALDLGRCHV